MDRLIQARISQTELRIHGRPFPLHPRISQQLNTSKLNFSKHKRVSSVSCKRENPSSHFSYLSSSMNKSSFHSNSTSGSSAVPSVVEDGASGIRSKRKAFTGGIVIGICALIASLIHPLLAPPAFATFQTAAKAGGAAAASAGRRWIQAELLSSAWTGFFAGCLHTLSGPDHLAALAPLSIGRSRSESAFVGALWGCGHDAGQVMFGLLFLLLKDRLHIEILQTWGARVVGLTLVIIGALGIKEALEVRTPCVALENGECDVSVYEGLENLTDGKKKIGFATFATGIVHGLQPDALMIILPALALPSRLAGGAFLVMFLLGTVVSMGSYTAFIGSCSQALKDRVPRITEKLTWASSLIAIGLGLAIIISQFFGFSLF